MTTASGSLTPLDITRAPEGGEIQAARGLFELIRERASARRAS